MKKKDTKPIKHGGEGEPNQTHSNKPHPGTRMKQQLPNGKFYQKTASAAAQGTRTPRTLPRAQHKPVLLWGRVLLIAN